MFSKPKLQAFIQSFFGRTMILISLLMLCRVLAMYYIPLNDSTEARYAEIARLMLSSNNWVSLMHYPNQYFWAKPPLSTWLSAISMQEFGVSALAARLPAIFLSIFCLAAVYRMALSKFAYRGAVWSVAVLATSFYFLLDAGTVMTDPALLSCVTLVMVSFWLRMQKEHPVWGYLVFIGWGLGLLAKGPVVAVFTVLPLIFWLTLSKQWKACWSLLPWVKGSLLTLVIALPWYILAERRMPGFLSYFIIGEHFMRFLKPGWTGDLYGFAHKEPMGMIWVFLLLGTLPWSGMLVLWMTTHKKLWKIEAQDKAWYQYLLCFILVPIVFFSFARNIIYPYVFPVLPAFALLVTTILLRLDKEHVLRRFFYTTSLVMGLVLVAASALFIVYPSTFSKSTDQMIMAWQKHRSSPQERIIYALNAPEYSSMFYSHGEALATRDEAQLCKWLEQGPQYLVLDSVEPCKFQSDIQQQYQAIISIAHRQRVDSLYRIDNLPEFCKKYS